MHAEALRPYIRQPKSSIVTAIPSANEATPHYELDSNGEKYETNIRDTTPQTADGLLAGTGPTIKTFSS